MAPRYLALLTLIAVVSILLGLVIGLDRHWSAYFFLLGLPEIIVLYVLYFVWRSSRKNRGPDPSRTSPPAREEVPDVDGFMLAVQEHAGLGGHLSSFGVSRILHVDVEGRRVDVGCNGTFVWVVADLSCPTFPFEAAVTRAPRKSYLRSKLLEDGSDLHATGDAAFDAEFLVLGADGGALVELLTPEARAYLLTLGDLNLELAGQELSLYPVAVKKRPHLRSELDLRCSEDPSDLPRMGEQLFTPRHVAEELLRLAGVARDVEAWLRAEAPETGT